MMELNQNVILIAIAVIGVLVLYYLHREVKRTQLDVQGLKVFSANIASYMEPPADNLTPPAAPAAPAAPTQPTQPAAPGAPAAEEKKDK